MQTALFILFTSLAHYYRGDSTQKRRRQNCLFDVHLSVIGKLILFLLHEVENSNRGRRFEARAKTQNKGEDSKTNYSPSSTILDGKSLMSYVLLCIALYHPNKPTFLSFRAHFEKQTRGFFAECKLLWANVSNVFLEFFWVSIHCRCSCKLMRDITFFLDEIFLKDYIEFLQTTDVTLNCPRFTETTKAKSDQWKLSTRGPSFSFYFPNVTYKTGQDLRVSFSIFSALCDFCNVSLFFKKN